MRDSVARANAAANEAVSGVWLVRSFHAEAGEARRYDDRLMDTHRLKTLRDRVRAAYLLARRVRGGVCLCVCVCVSSSVPWGWSQGLQ